MTREGWRIWPAQVFKPVHVKSLPAHAIRSLIIARKKVGQRVTLKTRSVVSRLVRLPRALTVAFIDKALEASEGIAGLSAAMRGLRGLQGRRRARRSTPT